MPSCAVINCTNRQFKGCGLTFHLFPFGRPTVLEQWITNVKRNGWTPNKKAVLCSAHFEDACFDKTGQTIRLRVDAVPTLFDPPGWKAQNYHQKQPLKKLAQDCPKTQPSTDLSSKGPSRDPTPAKPTFSLLDHPYSIQESPKTVKKRLNVALDHINNLHKRLKTTQQKSRRLQRRVKTLEDVVRSLQEQQLITHCTEDFAETFLDVEDYLNT